MKLVIEVEVDKMEKDFSGMPVIDGEKLERAMLSATKHGAAGRRLDLPSQGFGYADAGSVFLDGERIGTWELVNEETP